MDVLRNKMSNQQPYMIRKACLSDIEAMTKLHCESFCREEHVPVMLGKRFVRATYRWLVSSKKSYALVADSDGKIIGLVAVCDGPFTRAMFIACFPEFMLSILKNPMLILNKNLWKRLLRRPEVTQSSRKVIDQSGFAQMTIGAVDKKCRGKGVFPELVEETKSESMRRGSRAIRAGIYKKNRPSRSVFIKGGWLETPELETEDTVFYVAYFDKSFPVENGNRSAIDNVKKII